MPNPPLSGQPVGTAQRNADAHVALIQPHGVVLVLHGLQLRIAQVSGNLPGMLQRPLARVLDATLRDLGGDVERQVRAALVAPQQTDGQPLHCHVSVDGRPLALQGALYRADAGLLILELQAAGPSTADIGWPQRAVLRDAVQRLSEASTLHAVADALAASMRALTGHARVAVLQLAADGRGTLLAESQSPLLPAQPGPAWRLQLTPGETAQRMRQRVQVVADALAVAVPLLPGVLAGDGPLTDLSMCMLRNASPQHRRRLQAAGAVASLELSLVRGCSLWGVVVCHHHQPRPVALAMRAAVELLAEVASTRIAAIEHYGQAQLASHTLAQVQRLRQRLLDATAVEGDWKLALQRDPAALLQPLNASGAALLHDGQALRCGDAPASADLPTLAQWIDGQAANGGAFACSALAAANPALSARMPCVGSVLAVRLSATRPDHVMWFRQPPPLQADRGWSAAELAVAQAFGDALVDVIVQVNAVRLLIAERQLAQLRAAVVDATEAVVVADMAGHAFHANDAFLALAGCTRADCASLDALVARFHKPAIARHIIDQVHAEGRPWRGELALATGDTGTTEATLPVAMRAEPVPARDGSLLGLIFIFNDISASKRADAARHRLEAALSRAGRGILAHAGTAPVTDSVRAADDHGLMAAILTNASLAAMDIAEVSAAGDAALVLQELQAATERAAVLVNRLQDWGG